MVMPTRHVAGLEDLGPEEASDIWSGVTEAVKVLKASYKPDGVNLGANLGVAAGEGCLTISTFTSCPAGRGTPTS